jgi:5-histidylcysteine sulfoxide synthase/putative 4-mercaptohistidine N1-methyltranferase
MLQKAHLIAEPLIINQGNVENKRQEIKAYFNQTCDSYEALFETLKSDDAFYERPCSLRHPLIFYFGHTATFFTNKLVLAKLLPGRINPEIESMCAIGVDEMSWDDLNEAHYNWPSADAVRAYRDEVRQAVNQLIDEVEFSLPINWQSPMWPILMGIEHERIHLETSSVLIRQLPITSVQTHPLFPTCPNQGQAPENYLATVPAGEIQINHTDPAPFYGWDNEYGQHNATVKEFKSAAFLVSNQEYLAFVEDEGYNKPEYWNSEGDNWRKFSPVKHPTFWVKRDNAWYLRCMTEEIPMPWNWPVEVNQLEAHAFCKWKAQKTGKPIRLPSEDEYLRLRDHSQALNFTHQANWNLQKYASSTPIDENKTGDFYDVLGNVWQWSETPIYPFEGFKVHPLYDDFTMPTFDNKHNIFNGGSWISTGNEINGHSRYAFRRHFFQHAGFRYIESENKVQTEYLGYETDKSVSQYCEFHYGDEYFGMQNFAKNYANIAITAIQEDPDYKNAEHLSVLEAGCSVGRASFELAKYFNKVTGLDFSARFIQIANQLQQNDSIRYSIPIEGEIMDFKSKSLTELGLDKYASRCEFIQQDASNLKPHITGYDMVVASNLIERLYDPEKFLNSIQERLNSKGLLMVVSDYSWEEKYTKKDKWIGGYKDSQSGENVTSIQGLHDILDENFECISSLPRIPSVFRVTSRNFTLNDSEVTIWKKRT